MEKSRLKIHSKKGIFLTFIAISVIAAFVIIFTLPDINLGKDISVIKTRVLKVNEHVVDLENVYLERTLKSSSIKAMASLTKYMESQNKFLVNFEDSFKEVLLDGKINSIPIDDFIEPNIMTGNTYKDWINKTILAADDIFNVKSSITVNNIKINQSRPWFVTVTADISLLVVSETAFWDKNILVVSEVSIENFEDPYYTLNTAGSYKNKINKSSVQLTGWSLNNVSNHIKYGTYIHYDNTKAPNFLMRFTNTSSSSSCCGIESLVNPNKLPNNNLMESYADYLYFNHSLQDKCTQLYNVTSLYPEFRHLQLDFEHLALYNLTSYSFIEAC